MLGLAVTIFVSTLLSNIHTSDINTFYSNCLNTQEYGCYASPGNCSTSQNCDYGATWRGVSETKYEFQLISSLGDYVALGFPEHSGMGSAVVVGCSHLFTKPAVYFNTKSYTSSSVLSHSDFIDNYKVTVNGSSTSCEFTLTSSFFIVVNSTNTRRYDYNLNINPTFLNMAIGPVSDGIIPGHSKKSSSSATVDLTVNNQFLPSNITQFYRNCQATQLYGCYSSPANCTTTMSCDYGATWIGNSENVYRFQLISTSGDYVAIGFPESSGMRKAPVIGCSHLFTKPAVYYNTASHTSSPVSNYTSFLDSYKVVKDGNATSCEFLMTAQFGVVENDTKHDYNLNTNSTFINMAVGLVVNSTMIQHTKRSSSSSIIDLTEHNVFYIKDFLDSFYHDCNTSAYGCFTSPANCTQSKSCSFGATWRGISETVYEFTLIASSGDYVALGFPDSSSMGPAPVIGCSNMLKSPGVYVNTNSSLASSTPAFNHSNFLEEYTVVKEDNNTKCLFHLNSTFSLAATNTSGELSYDLNTNSTFLNMATGPLTNSLLGYHGNNRAKTSFLVDLTDHNVWINKNETNNTANSIYDDCGQTKGCFGSPNDCVDDKNCDIIVTYTKVTSSREDSGDKYKFEVGGKVGQDYSAVGLSLDDAMGLDSVMACVNSQSKQEVQMYWNPGGHSASVPLDDITFGLTDITTNMEDDFYTCTFYRETITNITIPGGDSTSVFNLDTTKYYLLLAYGPYSSGDIFTAPEYAKNLYQPFFCS